MDEISTMKTMLNMFVLLLLGSWRSLVFLIFNSYPEREFDGFYF